MDNARKKASFRKKVAYFFFLLLTVNIILKVLGISSLDVASTSAGSLVLYAQYYALPLVFLVLGVLFLRLSKAKAQEAASYALGGTNW